jgi:hypothetical protein
MHLGFEDIKTDKKLWREIIDAKYQTSEHNILCYNDRQTSPFGKG